MIIHLSDHFTYPKLLHFTFPSIIMMIFTSIYGVVDGLFVSNFVGKTAFASVNLVMPFLMVLGGIGSMFGTGGGALISKTLGEGDEERAHRYFTMMVRLMLIVGLLLSAAGILLIRPVSYLFGATDAMIGDCVLYGRTVLIFLTAQIIQFAFQSFLITAERPKLGLAVTIAAGVANMVLDALFVGVFRWGLAGAAVATGLSQCVGGLAPLVYFLSRRNDTPLRFAKTHMEVYPLMRACVNGASEMVSSISGSITGILYNYQLMRYAGENGVAAYGVVMYAGFIFIAIFVGYSNGSAPIVGYHYGAGNHKELKSMLRKSLILMGISGAVMVTLGVALSQPLADLFVGYDMDLSVLTVRAFKLCMPAILIMGINIYASAFFTALNNGSVSAVISFLRALVFPVIIILVLPVFFGLDGVWYSLLTGEFLGLIVSVFFLLAKRKEYRY